MDSCNLQDILSTLNIIICYGYPKVMIIIYDYTCFISSLIIFMRFILIIAYYMRI